MNKNIEYLMHNLPDYINGNLQDDGMRKEITELINNDPDFRTEYEDMKSSFTFLKDTSFSEPPGFYFNNLLPNINNRIDALEAKPSGVFSGWLSNALKFVIPALILVLGYFLYTQFTGTEQKEILTEDKQDTKQEVVTEGNDRDPIQNDISSNTEDTIEKNTIPDRENANNIVQPNRLYDAYVTTENNGGSSTLNVTDENSDELEEILYDNASYPIAADEIEEQAEELTLQQQDELLNYMANAQL